MSMSRPSDAGPGIGPGGHRLTPTSSSAAGEDVLLCPSLC